MGSGQAVQWRKSKRRKRSERRAVVLAGRLISPRSITTTPYQFKHRAWGLAGNLYAVSVESEYLTATNLLITILTSHRV